MGTKAFGIAAFLVVVPATAVADLYKFQKADGTVVYTDSLSQLPPARREYYNRQKQERETKQRDLERAVGKDEAQRRTLEAERARLASADVAESERQERIRALDAAIQEMGASSQAREGDRQSWSKRMRDAKANLQAKLGEFRELSEKLGAIAIQPMHTLLPGQAEEMDKLREDAGKMEREIDALVEEIEVRIPEEARRAGIPPGYLR